MYVLTSILMFEGNKPTSKFLTQLMKSLRKRNFGNLFLDFMKKNERKCHNFILSLFID